MPTLHNLTLTLRVLDSSVFRSIDLSLQVSSILFGLFDDWSQELISKIGAYLDNLAGAVFESLPLLLGLGLDVGGLALLDLCVEVVACLLDAGAQVPAHCGEDRVEKLAGSGDGFLDVVGEVDLLFLEAGTVLLNGRPHFGLLHRLGVGHQPCGVRKDLLEVGERGRVGEEGDGAEPILEVREDEGDGALVVDAHKIDALVDAVVEAADVEEVGGARTAGVEPGDLACPCVGR